MVFLAEDCFLAAAYFSIPAQMLFVQLRSYSCESDSEADADANADADAESLPLSPSCNEKKSLLHNNNNISRKNNTSKKNKNNNNSKNSTRNRIRIDPRRMAAVLCFFTLFAVGCGICHSLRGLDLTRQHSIDRCLNWFTATFTVAITVLLVLPVLKTITAQQQKQQQQPLSFCWDDDDDDDDDDQDNGDKSASCVSSSSRVTEGEQVEEEITQQQQPAKEEEETVESTKRKLRTFMAFLCHEIRNPLFAITTNLTFFMDDIDVANDGASSFSNNSHTAGNNNNNNPLTDNQQQCVLAIQQASRLLLRLVNDVLDLNKLETNTIEITPEVFDLHELVRQVAHQAQIDCRKRNANRVLFYYEVAPTVPQWIQADLARVLQIVYNLLSNATKFTEHGRIEFLVSTEQEEETVATPDETEERNIKRNDFVSQKQQQQQQPKQSVEQLTTLQLSPLRTFFDPFAPVPEEDEGEEENERSMSAVLLLGTGEDANNNNNTQQSLHLSSPDMKHDADDSCNVQSIKLSSQNIRNNNNNNNNSIISNNTQQSLHLSSPDINNNDNSNNDSTLMSMHLSTQYIRKNADAVRERRATRETTATTSKTTTKTTNEKVLLKLQVRDTGSGISPKRLETLFVPYSQEKLSDYRLLGGTGLGLAILSQLVELMGGTIAVESQVGVGTEFTVRLPMMTAVCASDELSDVDDEAGSSTELFQQQQQQQQQHSSTSIPFASMSKSALNSSSFHSNFNGSKLPELFLEDGLFDFSNSSLASFCNSSHGTIDGGHSNGGGGGVDSNNTSSSSISTNNDKNNNEVATKRDSPNNSATHLPQAPLMAGPQSPPTTQPHYKLPYSDAPNKGDSNGHLFQSSSSATEPPPATICFESPCKNRPAPTTARGRQNVKNRQSLPEALKQLSIQLSPETPRIKNCYIPPTSKHTVKEFAKPPSLHPLSDDDAEVSPPQTIDKRGPLHLSPPPRQQQQQHPPPPPKKQTIPKFNFAPNSNVVLVTDDNVVNRKMLGRMLSTFDLEFRHACDGKEAVDLILEQSRNVHPNNADLPLFGLIIMDLSMPVMGGCEAIRILRQHGVSIPMIALTANALEETQEDAMDAGATEFVTKPILRNDLYQKCELYLNNAAAIEADSSVWKETAAPVCNGMAPLPA